MAAPQRRVKDPVEENACRVEAIRKEMQHFRINETFTLNPRSCKCYAVKPLTDKPNRSQFETFAQPDNEMGLSSDLKEKLMRQSAVPKVKAPHPMTSNQEFGWDADLVTTYVGLQKFLELRQTCLCRDPVRL